MNIQIKFGVKIKKVHNFHLPMNILIQFSDLSPSSWRMENHKITK